MLACYRGGRTRHGLDAIVIMRTAQKKLLAFVGIALLCCFIPGQSRAGVDDCLKAALNTVNPDDLKKAAAFAANHSSCLQNLVPPLWCLMWL